ncbi:MAG: pyridoxal-phosphate dependent enzyme [Desulfobacteraceae bacterium]|nr:pyridoxal-phosphate dependent enzyme [Desulfobacteraceae bacterium]
MPFHCSLPGYRPTPLVRLPALAGYLGIQELFVKDENHRFDVKAFKVLGASYAMAKSLGEAIWPPSWRDCPAESRALQGWKY